MVLSLETGLRGLRLVREYELRRPSSARIMSHQYPTLLPVKVNS